MTFTADTVTYDVIEGVHVAGLSFRNCAGGYLLFQHSVEGDPDDWGIYIEFNDQSKSGYGLIRECRIDR